MPHRNEASRLALTGLGAIMAGAAKYTGAAVVTLIGIVLSSVSLLPVAVDRLEFNSASLSRELQIWRSEGQFYVHNRQDASTVGIFYIDDKASKGVTDENTLLLLHGFPSASYDFAGAFWEGLKSDYKRIIILDFLGYGFSDKPRTASEKYSLMVEADIIEGLLQHLGVQKVHILAHDVGDTVAQEMLARFNDRSMGLSHGLSHLSPLRILSLCFLNGGLFPEQHRASFTQKLLNNDLAGPIVSSMSTYGMFAGTFASVFGPKTQPSTEFLQDTYALLKFNGGKLILPQLLKYMAERHANRERWVGALINSTCQIGLINGPADPISGKHAAERYKELVPQPWVYMLDAHIGHYPHVEAPQAVLKAYKQFCEHVSRHA